MNLALLWRSAALQAALVAVVFAILVIAPLPEGFFRQYGVVTGPVAWIVCAAVTGALLHLGWPTTVLATLVSGALAAALGLLLTHTVGLAFAVLAFGTVCALRNQPAPAPAG